MIFIATLAAILLLSHKTLAWTEISTSRRPHSFCRLSSACNGDQEGCDASSNTRRHFLYSLPAVSSLLSVPQSARALSESESKRIAIFEKTAPSVVFLDTFTERRDQFSPNIMEVPLGSGSGFVWDKEGHIVTNYHVVRNALTAQIAILTDAACQQSCKNDVPIPYTSMRGSSSFGNGNIARSVFKAKVVGVDPSKDIAVLKVDAPPELLQPIAVGTSKGLKVGQTALAIGNPFGLDHTLTTGIVSGLGREVRSPIGRPISNVIQTDAAINPGNSGGPLLDSSGKLIGMNTAIYSPSGASSGIGFAIPSDTIKFVVETLIRDGRVVRPIIGISYLESRQARSLGITNGVLILDVPPGSPAAAAGLKGTRRTENGLIEIGDIIIQVGNTKINREADLFEALEDLQPGDVVEVKVNRLMAK
ncbi:hypothetical protein FisN_13Lh084 [Fistulifera solaris]|uniref:PDZ domain-containing protein n=1 Tax=Fistulifera solaris TaxID=1519565 RepID=A0A1Z5JF73_FISSO|nr:hypothetical protein FisN_13Lh084 [Fistulifera solaris]|eukprot:GAX12619.1 hypothetical protein FisN_13Lh084 [Fistulifera solaris]